MSLTEKIGDDILSGAISLLIAFAIVGLVGALGYIIRPAIDRSRLRKREKEAVIFQCADLIRHMQRNKNVLESIKRKWKNLPNQIFAFSHLQKLNFISQSASFSHELYRLIPPEMVGEIHHLKIKIRNIEISLKEFRKIYRKKACDEIFDEIDRVIEQFDDGIKTVRKIVTRLGATECFINSRAGDQNFGERDIIFRKCSREFKNVCARCKQ